MLTDTGFRNVLPALKLRALGEADSFSSRLVGCPRSSTEALMGAGDSDAYLSPAGDALFMYFVGIGGGGLGGADC